MTFVDPNRPGRDGTPVLVDRARFEPASEETIDGVACRKYRITGPVFDGADGFLWVNRTTGHLERAEHPIRSSVDWTDFRVDLVRTETMDALGWERFKLALADKQRPRPNPPIPRRRR